MALQLAGFDAVVYEAYASWAPDHGTYLTVATNGLDALAAIGAHRSVVAAGFPTTASILLTSRGSRLRRFPLGGVLADGTVTQTIKRPQLHAALRDEARGRGIRIEFGKRLVGASSERDGEVVARFADGTDARGDVLIGCDGVWSSTRDLIDPSAPRPRYIGMVNFGGYTPASACADCIGLEPGVWHMMYGRRAFFGWVMDPHGGVVWFANVPGQKVSADARVSLTRDIWKQRLVELFTGDALPAADLIGRGVLEVAADNTYDLLRVPTWHRDSMIVIGDAAHAPSSISGHGASMAIEDAVVLGKCLRDVPDVPSAFRIYERLRRGRVERMVEQVARGVSNRVPGRLAYGTVPTWRRNGRRAERASDRTSSRVGAALRDQALRAVFTFFVTDRTLGWTYDHHIAWDVSESEHEPLHGRPA
jgi:2-polyprenyl-6-methoxyphenol hydroxylase-like FAD-dependent oxidoreductase